jgi:hypothetical protein
MTESIWVYVNNPNDKAILDIADCVSCNDGQGVAQQTLKWNGE